MIHLYQQQTRKSIDQTSFLFQNIYLYRLSLSKITRKIPKTVAVSMQKFRWEPSGGYISCWDEPNFVFGVKEIESKVVEVILKRRNPDDIFQRWIIIHSNVADNEFNEQEEQQSQLDLTIPL